MKPQLLSEQNRSQTMLSAGIVQAGISLYTQTTEVCGLQSELLSSGVFLVMQISFGSIREVDADSQLYEVVEPIILKKLHFLVSPIIRLCTKCSSLGPGFTLLH